MKHVLICMLLAIMAAFPAVAKKEEVRNIPAFPQNCSASAYGDICLHAFGGTTARIPLALPHNGECKNISLQLYQLSDRLAAPIGKSVALTDSACDSVTLSLPEVKEPAVLRISYLDNGHGLTKTEGTLIEVYPSDLWSDLKSWSKDNQLIVNDRGGKLIALLEEHHITYSPVMLPRKPEPRQQVCIWVPTVGAQESPLECPALLVLHEKSEGLPLIYVHDSHPERRTDVYMPMLDALSYHPLVQKTFIDLVQSQLGEDS